jgi:hypothetical protein
LRAKNGPDEAEAEGFGYSKVEADNEILARFFAATRRDGADFSDRFVARRSNTPGISLSSLRALGKILSRRCPLQS